MVDCLTDNKTRTVADVRHAFTKNGGNLGTDGCVAFNFVHQGYLVFEPGVDEDALMEAALEAGAEDVITNDDGSIEVITAPNDWAAVKSALEAAGYKSVDGDVTMRAQNETELSGEDAVKMQKLIDALEDLDDVQDVYTSAVLNLDKQFKEQKGRLNSERPFYIENQSDFSGFQPSPKQQQYHEAEIQNTPHRQGDAE